MKNRVLGSIFIVAGTTIGAGMLAMPLALAGVGFSITFVMLLILWLLMCYTALLLVETYQHVEIGLGFGALARRYLGPAGHWLTSLSMMFLMYALTSAYISGGGELMTLTLSSLSGHSVDNYWGIITFAAIGGLIVIIGTHSVDLINRILFISKFIFLFFVLFTMAKYVSYTNLLSLPLQQGLTITAIPIVFTSFGFHGSVPSIVQYMNYDIAKLRKIFFIGSFIPFATYLLWQLVTLGSIDSQTFISIIANQSGLNGLLMAVREVVATPIIETALHRFADLALATSFLGVSLGLFDYMAEFCRRKNNFSGRIQTGLITFTPPVIFALFYPRGFILALGYAAIALAILALMLPAMLVWQTRKRHKKGYQVRGGPAALMLVFFSGIAIIIIQLNITFN